MSKIKAIFLNFPFRSVVVIEDELMNSGGDAGFPSCLLVIDRRLSGRGSCW